MDTYNVSNRRKVKLSLCLTNEALRHEGKETIGKTKTAEVVGPKGRKKYISVTLAGREGPYEFQR
jgi:hypothetical protein